MEQGSSAHWRSASRISQPNARPRKAVGRVRDGVQTEWHDGSSDRGWVGSADQRCHPRGRKQKSGSVHFLCRRKQPASSHVQRPLHRRALCPGRARLRRLLHVAPAWLRVPRHCWNVRDPRQLHAGSVYMEASWQRLLHLHAHAGHLHRSRHRRRRHLRLRRRLEAVSCAGPQHQRVDRSTPAVDDEQELQGDAHHFRHHLLRLHAHQPHRPPHHLHLRLVRVSRHRLQLPPRRLVVSSLRRLP
mmetsp:Transcript_31125/g.62754  ORF Transcript_31125/g.62754 Transcript_31125/m.62754 type:complete len:244 (-) Transcript_31125:1159-1890(-)